jgi:hypothetical protein
LSDVETVIVIVPWESGSGKFGTPWERMQAVYLTPAAVPTCLEMLAPIPAPLGGSANALELLLAPLLEVVVSRLAIDGDFAPPPQPTASNATPARAAKSGASPPLVSAARHLLARPFTFEDGTLPCRLIRWVAQCAYEPLEL